MEKRVISTQVQEEDLKIEKSLRPQTLDDYIGQQKAKENLKIYIEAAKARGESLDHWIMCCFMDLRGWERLHFPRSLPMRWEHI